MEDLIEALKIFMKYANSEWPTNCSHDVLAIMDVAKDQVSEDDRKRLDELSFRWSDEHDCYISFRFGSA